MRRIIGIVLVLTFSPLAAAPPQNQAPTVAETPSVSIRQKAGGTDIARPDTPATSRSDMVVVGDALGMNGPLSGASIVVVPDPALALSALPELNEDLQIMCRVLDYLLDDANVQTHNWNAGPFQRTRSSTRCLFLPRFGALFLVEVAFPLAPDSQTRDEKTDDEEPDALWRQVRDNLHGRSTGTRGSGQKPAPAYDEGKVESLKRTLLAAMKHTANIRHLRPEDQLLIAAIESSQEASVQVGFPAQVTNVIVVGALRKDVEALLGGASDAATLGQMCTVVQYQQPALAVGSPVGSY